MVFAIRQYELAIGIHAYPPSWTLLPAHPLPLDCHRALTLYALRHTSNTLIICFIYGNIYVSGEGNGSPLQHSCLGNLMDGGAWWAAVHGVAQSRTWPKRLSMPACIGEGNGNPLQCSCLENPRDRGAWWAAIYGIAQSQTQLKQLSI